MAAPTTSRPNPEHIFNTMVAFQESAALKAAIELDIFTAIADGANTPARLAAKIGAVERSVRILCDYMTIKGFLTKEAERYALTQETESPFTSLLGFDGRLSHQSLEQEEF